MRKSASRPDAENPEWTAEEIRSARPLIDVLPKATAAAVGRYRGQRGPQRTPTKEHISLRVDRDIAAAFRASGRGWQTRVNDALRMYARENGLGGYPPAARGRRRRAASSRHA